MREIVAAYIFMKIKEGLLSIHCDDTELRQHYNVSQASTKERSANMAEQHVTLTKTIAAVREIFGQKIISKRGD